MRGVNNYVRPIVADIGNQTLFIYNTIGLMDLSLYAIRISEAFMFDCFLDSSAKVATSEMYDGWCSILGTKNPYIDSYYGLFMDGDHIFKFLNIFINNMTPEEKSIIYHLEKNNVIRYLKKERRYEILKDHSFIFINGFLCSTDGISREITLMHELSHLFYQTDKEYRKYINAAYQRTGRVYQELVIQKLISKLDPTEARVEDEWAAYLIDNKKLFVPLRRYSRFDTDLVYKHFAKKLAKMTNIRGTKNNLLIKTMTRVKKETQ